MKLLERTFELRGPEGLGAKPRPELIGPVFSHLHDTLQDAVRMGFLHSSRAQGRIPACLRAAADVHYVGHSAGGEGGTLLRFEVPSFGSVAGELFGQKLLWEDGPQPEQTAFELLGFALTDVRKRLKKLEFSLHSQAGQLRPRGVSCGPTHDHPHHQRFHLPRPVFPWPRPF